MKVGGGNWKKAYFFTIFKGLYLQQFSSNLYMLYTKIIVYFSEIHNHSFFGQNLCCTGCPVKNVFLIYSAIPKIHHRENWFFLAYIVWYICGHMWYIKFHGVFDYKVVKFHFWTPCKYVFSFHGTKKGQNWWFFFKMHFWVMKHVGQKVFWL